MKNFGIFKKLLLAFLVISLLPLLISGGYSIYKIKTMNNDFVEVIQNTIEKKTQETIELQAVMVAAEIENYLKQSESDLLALKETIASSGNYLNFYANEKGYIWTASGLKDKISDERYQISKYKEMVFFDTCGFEQIKIINGKIVPKNKLQSFSKSYPLFKGIENFYEETKKLNKSSIYVTHLMGKYLNKNYVKKYSGELKELFYDGVIFFATPIYENSVNDSDEIKLKGVLAIALDHRNLMEFTQHILPNEKTRIPFPSYNSGDYAFMFDDEGWIITHPKLWDIRGIDERGELVKPYSINSSKSIIESGYLPFNLDSANFIHPNYPKVSEEVRKLKTGSMITTNIGGTKKIMAYAPIIYGNGVYKKSGVFGGITIGSEYERFNRPAKKFSDNLKNEVSLHIKNMIQIGFFTFFIAIFLSWFISRNFSLPLIALANATKKMIKFNFKGKLYNNREDEIAILANSYNNMLTELRIKEDKLLNSVENLKKSKIEIENHTKELEFTINIQRTIQKISNKLGTTFSIESILKYILKDCVESLSFDRAILYLKDEKNKYLEFKELYGFKPEDEVRLNNSKYNLQRYDCIETKVAKLGKIIFIEDFENYNAATVCDIKIRKISKSNSFVYIPIIVKGEIIGILGSDKLYSGDKITQNDIDYLQIITNQVARVMETTQLYQKVIDQRNFRENILKNMLNGIITTDIKGNVNSINIAAEKLLETNKLEIMGRSIWDILPENLDVFKNIKEYLLKKQFYKGYDNKVLIKGKLFYINLFISKLTNSESKDDGYVVILQDTTKQNQMNEHLQKLERLASLGQFAAGIAHEIRNPLTGISLFLDDLFEQISENKEMTQIVTLALNEIERLEKLINEILSYSTKSKSFLANSNFMELVKSTSTFIEKQSQNRSIEIIYDLPNTDSIIVNMDSEKIRQAMLNLLSNAINAIPESNEKGTILITLKENVKNIPPILVKDTIAKWLKLSISDNGRGITTEDGNKIFEPFFTTRVGGTGLGLSITHSIITDHGGLIFLDKRLKETSKYSTTFTIYLPQILENNDDA